MPRKIYINRVNRVVIKIGTSTITENGKISLKKISLIAEDIFSIIEKGYRVVLITSGAISAGKDVVNFNKEKNLSIPERQALASVGQIILINKYREAFKKFGLNVGQILLTEDDLKNRRRFLNARNTITKLLDSGVIPIINENDSVVVKEIKFGDNDTLSAYITSVIDADLLILLSDVDGFFWDMKDKEPVEEIKKIDEDIIERAGGSGSKYGTGGMATKIRAAEIVMLFGEMMIIANGEISNVLEKIMNGNKIGTLFIGNEKKMNSRKKWLSVIRPKGILVVDDGAVVALLEKKKSLLASGIIKMEKSFNRGDAVEIQDKRGNKIGKGIINYNNIELQKIIGKKTSEIKKIFGDRLYDEVINRNDLIIF